MTKALPERADLGQLKIQAKELLAGVRAAGADALARIGASDAASFALHDAQRAVAREYGFPSWAKLKHHIEAGSAGDAEASAIRASLAGNAKQVGELRTRFPSLAGRSLHAACALGDAAEVRRWLEREPGLARAKGGPRDWEPLQYLCFGQVGHGDRERADAARALLGCGADPNAWHEEPAWPGARETVLYGATGVNNRPELARVLLAAGADPNDGESRFHAAERYHVECLEVLSAFGTDFSRLDPQWGNTPLYFLLGWQAPPESVRSGIRWLLEHGANPNLVAYPKRMAETALHLAVRNGWDLPVIGLLLSHGADPAIARADGLSAYALAVRGGREDVAVLLRERGAAPELAPADEFLGACMRGDADTARAWLRRIPGLVASLDADQGRIVLEAAREGRVPAIRLMGELGFNLGVKGGMGETALHVAGWRGRAEAVALLIGQGADVDSCDDRFHATPLGWVAHASLALRDPAGDYPACARALAAAGARVPEGVGGSPGVREALGLRGGGEAG